MAQGDGPGFDDALLREIRDRFVNVDSDPFSGKRIYFENAGGTLRLKSVVELVSTLTGLPDNAGRLNPASREVDEAITRGRRDIALFLGARSGTIAAEQSTTGMIFRILDTAARSGGSGNLVITNLDHASSFDATKIIAERYCLEARIASLDPATGQVPAENIASLVDQDTVAVTVIHASNILGAKNDVVGIVRGVREAAPNALVILDGAQHASHGVIDVESYGADAWVFVPYKTYSKVGTSFAWLSDRLARLPHDNLLGKPKDMWDLGTRETAAYAGMSKVVEYFQWLGSKFTDSADARDRITAAMRAIEAHEGELLRAMLHGTGGAKGMLQLDAVRVYGNKEDAANQEAIVAFNVAGMDSTAAVEHFGRSGIRVHNRISDCYSKHTLSAMGIEECVRASLCHYNTPDEVAEFLRALEKMAR